MKRSFIVTLLIFTLVGSLFADDSTSVTQRAKMGFWTSYNLNTQNIKTFHIDGLIDCCEDLRTGYGSGISVGTLLELPIYKDVFWGLRVGYLNQEAEFENDFVKTYFQNGLDSTDVTHSFLADFSTISLESYISGRVYDNWYLNFGYMLGYFNFRGYEYNYEPQPEVPGVLTTIDGKKGTVDGLADFILSLNLGVSYEFSLDENKSMLLVPELNYSVALFDIHPDTYWRINTLRAGLSFKYSPDISKDMIREMYIHDTVIVYRDDVDEEYLKIGISESKEYETKEGRTHYKVLEVSRIDTLIRPKDLTGTVLYSDLNIYGKLPTGNLFPVNNVLLKVEISKKTYPMLPFIFFNEKSSKIPDRYNYMHSNHSFNLGSYYPNPIKYHHNILNIIADRMLKYPHSKITLKGYIDKITEGNDCKLAFGRAESVKKYLVDYCQINAERIMIDKKGSCYPKAITKALTQERYEENRRVEISASSSKILEPIQGDWYQQPKVIVPDLLFFDVSGSNLDEINDWTFRLYQNEFEMMKIQGDEKENLFEYKLSNEDVYLVTGEEKLTADYTAFNSIGEFSSAKHDLDVLIDTANYEVESLNIALFDVSNFVLTPDVKEQIREFIKLLDKDDELYIYGFTDKLGDANQNVNLAKNRAYQTAMYINKLNPTIKIESVEAVADKKFAPGIESYKTPEERFFSRSVEIQIRRKKY